MELYAQNFDCCTFLRNNILEAELSSSKFQRNVVKLGSPMYTGAGLPPGSADRLRDNIVYLRTFVCKRSIVLYRVFILRWNLEAYRRGPNPVGCAANNKLDFQFIDHTAALLDDFVLGLTHPPLLAHRMRHLKPRYYTLIVSDKSFLSLYIIIITV